MVVCQWGKQKNFCTQMQHKCTQVQPLDFCGAR
nr:MAG TPA: GCS1 Male gamete fusion factor [Caudoviricetes sp.]